MEPLKATLEKVFRGIVSEMLAHPDKLGVTTTQSARGCELAARPWNSTDKGKLIGGKAENHRAMQCVLAMVARKQGQSCRYIIIPSQRDEGDTFSPFEDNPAWKPDRAQRALTLALDAMFDRHTCGPESGGGATTFKVTVSAPNDETTALVEWALNKLLHAAGNAQGRKIFVKVKGRP